jgi:hypothetical protein
LLYRSPWPAIGLGALAMFLACSNPAGGGGPFLGTVSRSQFFEYHDRVDEPLCPTLLSLLDEHALRIGGKIGLDPDPARPFRYYKFRDGQDLASSGACGSGPAACAPGDTVRSSEYFDAHELAHDYVNRAWQGQSIGLLNEGEAVALSCYPSSNLQPSVRPADALGNPDWRSLLYLQGNTTNGYVAAGLWMTNLAATYGWERARQLHQRVRPGISAADFEREFAQVYPLSMDEAWSQALDTAGAPPCQDEWNCDATPLDVGSTVQPACDGQMHRTITVTDQPGVVLGMGGMNSELLLRDCGATRAPTYELTGGWTTRTTHAAVVPPGIYTLFSAPAPTDVTFVSYLPAGFGAPACTSASGVALDPAQVTYLDLLAGSIDGWVPLAGGGSRYNVETLNLFWNGFPAAAGAAICDGCDVAAACLGLPGGAATTVAVGAAGVLRLQGVTAFAATTLYGQVVFYPDAVPDAGSP